MGAVAGSLQDMLIYLRAGGYDDETIMAELQANGATRELVEGKFEALRARAVMDRALGIVDPSHGYR